jgi:hypothetical protein
MLRPLNRLHVAPNDAWVILIFLAVVVLLLSSCAGSNAQRPVSNGSNSTSTTSGTVTAAPTSSNDQLASQRISELETERDHALLQASEAQTLATSTRERSEKALKSLVARNDFEDSMWGKLERIDARMKSIRYDSAHLAPDVRWKVQRQLESIADRRIGVEREMHRVHGVPVADFDGYAKGVEKDINAVARDVESIELK